MRLAVLFLLTLSSALAWYPVAPMPAPRYGAAAVVIGDEGLVLGGTVTGGVKTRTTFVYHHCRDDWTVGESLLVARHRFGAAVVGSTIYAFGGWADGGVLLGHAEYLASGGRWTEFDSLPTPRASLMAASVNGKIYAIGGRSGTATYATVDEYDPGTGDWTPKQPMPTARSEAAVAVVDGLVHVIGGTTDGTDVLDVVEVYDPAADSWFTGTPIPTARAMPGCVAVGGRICVFGGIGPGLTNTHAVELYHPALDTWTEGEPLPSSRRSLAGFSLFDARVYAVGGLDSLMQPTTLNERWDPPSAILEPSRAVPPPRQSSRLCRAGDFIAAPGVDRAWRVDIRSADGRTVGTRSVTSGLTCPDLAQGVYLLDWRSAGQAAHTRLVVTD